jgi:hypothetical protein
MLTPEQAFRAGFMLRCAEEGLTGSALDERCAQAAEFAKQAANTTLESVLGLATKPLIYAPLLGIGAGAGVGALAGAMTAPEDPGKIRRPPFLAQVQNAELADTYRQQAAELRRLAARARQRSVPVRSPYGI